VNIAEIESNLEVLCKKRFDPQTFPFDFIEAHGALKATLTRLRQRSFNKTKRAGDVLWAGKLYYRAIEVGDFVVGEADNLLSDPLIIKYKLCFVFVIDGCRVYVRISNFLNILYPD
jgi:hypothetical protein